MKKYRFLLTMLAVFLLCASIAFVSCTGTGDETTVGADQSSDRPEPSVTDEPTLSPEVTEEPTTSPNVTDEPTAEATTEPAPDVTTEESTSEVTTEAPEVTTEPPHEHSWTEWNTVELVKCTEAGKAERTCSCGAKETMSIEPIGHRYGEWIIDKEATATEEGSKHQVCASCGETIKTETIPVTPHVPGEWIVDNEATCTEAGSKHRVCTECGEIADTEVIPAKGHKEVIDPAKNATCTESGLTEGKHCSVCNAVITAQNTVPAKGHKEVIDPAKDSTCTESGLTAGAHCSVCNEVLSAQTNTPAKGHTEKTVSAKAPTCTESGLSEGKTCAVCSAVIVAQQTVQAIGHTAGEWITDKEPTLTETRSKHQICSVCGATLKTETIPVLEPNKIDYSVTVVDGFGAPVSDVKVTFMSAGKVAAEFTTDASGKVYAKLELDEYDVVLESADAYYFSSESCKVSASAPSVEISLIKYANSPDYVYPDEKNGVYSVSVGSIRVPVKKDEIRYFFFAPAEGAVYHVYTDSDKVEVGYYGGSFFVTDTNTGTVDENGVLILEVLHSQIGNKLVLGLTSKSSSVDECTLTIVRASDIGVSLEELLWEQYQWGELPKMTTIPEGTLTYVPIEVNLSTMSGPTTEIKVVYSEKDGYYHLHTEDGPVLYARLAMSTKYLDPIKTVANVTNIGNYIYDENGNFVKKESYVDAILAYCTVADPKYGVVPLNEELIYILKNAGEGGWYDRSSPNCIFEGVVVMPFNGWLFAVCYFE